MNPSQKAMYPSGGPYLLDRVNIRRMLLYIQQRLKALWEKKLNDGMTNDWLQNQSEAFMFDVNEKKGVFKYEVAVGEYSILVGIQFKETTDWTWMEMERGSFQCNIQE